LGLRSQALVELVAEVLGPRGGIRELMRDDPRTEYVSGVLRPEPSAGAPLPPDELVDADLMFGAGGDDSSEEDDDDAAIVGAIPASPSIDPTQLPRSIGLSFMVGGDTPTMRLCCTWARYLADPLGGWRRTPEAQVTDWIELDRSQRAPSPVGTEIWIEVAHLGSGARRVSVYLINTRAQTDAGRSGPTEHLFQPQIRVALGPSTAMFPLDGDSTARELPDDGMVDEDDELGLLYGSRQGFARGHMCGALWRDVDPERDAGELNAGRPFAAPFAFVDGDLLAPAERRLFSPADLRTDFVPTYSVQAPASDWRDTWGPRPELEAVRLAEIWQPAEIDAALRPLLVSYRSWCLDRRVDAELLTGIARRAADANLESCERFAARLEAAIRLLGEDEAVRLAFCFANRAMAEQGRWSRGRDLVWRPFQLAFLLVALRSTAYPDDDDRSVCDLLWFPTGGGKTEGYLALAAFTIAYRRLRSDQGGGTGVLSRYTLRLLTIQQFRRALITITSCERLRVAGLSQPGGIVGWRPFACPRRDTFLWGGERFSAGLWVGGGVTPNRLHSMDARIDGRFHCFLGAVEILEGARPQYTGPNQALATRLRHKTIHLGGEPAQVANCPCCRAVLAVADGSQDGGGLPAGDHVVHVPHSTAANPTTSPSAFAAPEPGVDLVNISTVPMGDLFVSSLTFRVSAGAALKSRRLDEWWASAVEPRIGTGDVMCARPSRPGYVLVRQDGSTGPVTGFEVLCPNPDCQLNSTAWAENVPVIRSARTVSSLADRSYRELAHADLPSLSGYWQDPPQLETQLSTRVSSRMPIPACTVDDQIYAQCPSLLVATADKFARLAFEPKAAGIFGNVDHYHARYGYYRVGAPPGVGQEATFRPHPKGGKGASAPLHVGVLRFEPPDLVIQDELHLIEGPLGSMVGLYETALEALGEGFGQTARRPKYVASTATIRQAAPQVRALFDRSVAQFPPQGLRIDDSFFAVTGEPHQLDELEAGRLYAAVAAPGKGAQTPIVRIWSSLLQSGQTCAGAPSTEDPDRLWTLAGYFNAVRELAGAATLYRQDIPERMRHRFGASSRPTDLAGYMELSSRADSVELPSMLEKLALSGAAGGIDVVCATSMFGTGVDIDRLGLMVIHGQPKTTSTYIQATGRVGRRSGALVVTFLRAARPRDLDHYEYFTAYHRALYRHVEAITVSPFAPKARERCLGPLSVALLRQASTLDGHRVDQDWKVEQRLAGQQFHSEARRMEGHRRDAEVAALPVILERRAQSQPDDVRPPVGVTATEVEAELDRWQLLARRATTRNDLVYYEPAMTRVPTREVVLGDPQHTGADLPQAFENAPQSLRAIEETTTFRT